MVKKTALNTTGELIYEGSDEVLTEGIYQNFMQATPANLKMVEGLWFNNQENEKLLTLLIKGYGAYAFAGMETEALEDILLEKENSEKVQRTILYYQKAIQYGLKFLELKGISKDMFWDKSFPEKLAKTFSAKLSDDDLVAIFYFAQSLGSSVNLQRTNIAKMAYMNHVKKMFEWVCSEKPDIEHGSCQLFDAIFLASLPSMMGGDVAKAETILKKIIAEKPYNLLAQLAYVQFYSVPMMDEESFNKSMKALKNNIFDWYQLQLGNPNAGSEKYRKHPEFNLFNAIARERFFKLKKLKSELI
tara:strand:- start:26554 stop:27459 length:906 start_codon:yes stop_codon:yes gene_type:complete